MLGELRRVAGVEVARGDDDVGVDVSAVLVGVSGELHELLLGVLCGSWSRIVSGLARADIRTRRSTRGCLRRQDQPVNRHDGSSSPTIAYVRSNPSGRPEAWRRSARPARPVPVRPRRRRRAPLHDDDGAGVESLSRRLSSRPVAFALWLRFYRIGEPIGGYHAFNEGFYTRLAALDSQRGLFAWVTNPLDFNNPPLFTAIVSLAFRLFTPTIAVARGVSVVAGLAAASTSICSARNSGGIAQVSRRVWSSCSCPAWCS